MTRKIMSKKAFYGVGVLLAAALLFLVWFAIDSRRVRYATTVPDTSATRSLQRDEDKGVIIINFTTCTPDLYRLGFAQGSTTIEIVGVSAVGDLCRMYFGSETENPDWDGALDSSCRVPRSQGRQELSYSAHVDFDPIREFCNIAD